MTRLEGEDNLYIPSAERGAPSFKDQYKANAEALERSKVVSLLDKTGNAGFYAEAGGKKIECSIPTWQEVQGLIYKNRELVKQKGQQGFNGLLLTPFLPYTQWEHQIKLNLLRKDDEGKLFLESRDPERQKIRAKLDREEPFLTWNPLRDAARSGQLIYFPREYGSNYNGKTQQEVILDKTICPVPGWSVSLIETNNFIPRQGEGQTIGGRKQLENNLGPQEYLEAIKKPHYQGESDFTLDDIYSRFLINLQTRDAATYDLTEYNSIWATGNYDEVHSYVPVVYWSRDDNQLYVNAFHSGFGADCGGTRTAVRLS